MEIKEQVVLEYLGELGKLNGSPLASTCVPQTPSITLRQQTFDQGRKFRLRGKVVEVKRTNKGYFLNKRGGYNVKNDFLPILRQLGIKDVRCFVQPYVAGCVSP